MKGCIYKQNLFYTWAQHSSALMMTGLSREPSQGRHGHSSRVGHMFTLHRLQGPIHSSGTVPSVLRGQKVWKLCVLVLGGVFSLRQAVLLPWNLLKDRLFLKLQCCRPDPCLLLGSLHFKTYSKRWRGHKEDCGAEATQCGLAQSSLVAVMSALSLIASGRHWTFLHLFWLHFPHQQTYPGTAIGITLKVPCTLQSDRLFLSWVGSPILSWPGKALHTCELQMYPPIQIHVELRDSADAASVPLEPQQVGQVLVSPNL